MKQISFCITCMNRLIIDEVIVFGRICLKKRGFIAMKGYNEALVGYGFEDAEFYDGLES